MGDLETRSRNPTEWSGPTLLDEGLGVGKAQICRAGGLGRGAVRAEIQLFCRRL